MGRGKKR